MAAVEPQAQVIPWPDEDDRLILALAVALFERYPVQAAALRRIVREST